MITVFLITLCAFVSSLALAGKVVDKNKSGGEYLFYGFFFLIAHISFVIFVAGIVFQSLSQSVIILASLSISGINLLINWRNLFPVLLECATGLQKIFEKIRYSYTLVIISLLLVVQHSFTLFRIFFAPINVLDTLTYHMPILVNWLQADKISLFFNTPVARQIYTTKGPKFLNFWFLRFSESIQFMELSQYFGYLLLLFASYALLKNFSVKLKTRIIITSAISFIPLVMIQLYSFQDHMLLAGIHLAVINILLDLYEKRIKPFTGILLSGAGIALLLSAKFSAPAHVIAIVTSSIAVYFSFIKDHFKKLFLPLICAIFIAVSFGGIWYLNNYIHYGSFFGERVPQASSSNKLIKNLVDFPLRIIDSADRYTPDTVNISAFGIIVFALGISSLIIGYKKIKDSKQLIFLLLTSSLSMLFYFIVYYTPYNYRLLIFFPVTMLIISAVVIEEYLTNIQKGIVHWLIVFGMVFTFITTIFSDHLSDPVRAWHRLFDAQKNERTSVRFDSLSDKFSRDRSFIFIDQYLPEEEPLFYFTQGEPGYDDHITSTYFSKNILRKVTWLGEASQQTYLTTNLHPTIELYKKMMNENVSYLHHNIVYYRPNPVQLRVYNSYFIPITPQLFMLPDVEKLQVKNNVNIIQRDNSINVNADKNSFIELNFTVSVDKPVAISFFDGKALINKKFDPRNEYRLSFTLATPHSLSMLVHENPVDTTKTTIGNVSATEYTR